MIRAISESDDGMLSSDQIDSPPIDDGNDGGSANGEAFLKKGPWTSAEDAILVDYVNNHGEGNWNAVQKNTGLSRCGKSCRLRWANHLRPNLKKGTFTPGEERLIIELHAKMGNKWARMAAHLPGRTDNEIKNYWNTRIKRRQRAGLPLYPPEVCLQALQENQQNHIHGDHNGDNRENDILQTGCYEIPDVIFDNLKANHGVLPYIPELPDFSISGMLMKGLGSSQTHSFMPPNVHRQKRLRESMAPLSGYITGVENLAPPFDHDQNDGHERKISETFDLSSTVDDDLMTKTPIPFGINQGSHGLLNSNFSASKPVIGAVKLELPSFQYSDTDFVTWEGSPFPPPLFETVDSFIQSPPPSGSVQSDGLSPRNSGLLDAVLHEAKILNSAKNHSSDKSSNSSSVTPGDIADSSVLNFCSMEWEDFKEPISSLGNSQTSIFSEHTPISTTGSSFEENPPADTFPGCNVKSEPAEQTWTLDEDKKETSTLLDFSRPDAWFMLA